MSQINIGILSGGGKLPFFIGKNLDKSKYKVIFFCIENFCDKKLYSNEIHDSISINSLTKIIRKLKSYNIDKIIMAGHVKRPSVKDIKFDINALQLIKDFALSSKGDDGLLSAISFFFEKKGFKTLNWKSECQNLFVNDDLLTSTKPTKSAVLNKKKGLNFFQKIGKADVAQSIIIQNNIILGIEAAEGTDELIKRCFNYKKKGDKGILLKLSKYNQNVNFDIPVIGMNTVKNIKKYEFEGLFLEKNKCIILDKEKVIDFCNQNKIFIASVLKN